MVANFITIMEFLGWWRICPHCIGILVEINCGSAVMLCLLYLQIFCTGVEWDIVDPGFIYFSISIYGNLVMQRKFRRRWQIAAKIRFFCQTNAHILLFYKLLLKVYYNSGKISLKNIIKSTCLSICCECISDT